MHIPSVATATFGIGVYSIKGLTGNDLSGTLQSLFPIVPIGGIPIA
jgi:hypothetical protein